MAKHEFYTPQELIEKFPDIVSYGWDSSFIGKLFNTNFLHGKHKNGKALISIKSFTKLLTAYKELNIIKIKDIDNVK